MKIMESNNYNKFVLCSFNRDVKRTRWLEESMLKYGWLDAYPMQVKRLPNGNFEIIAGHHRYFVARKLGIPLKYVEENQEVSIHELEQATVPWTMRNWLDSHVRAGKKDYATLLEFHKKTGISISLCISLLSLYADGGRLNANFKDGQFEVGSIKHALLVGEIIIFCKSVGIRFARDRSFVAAVAKISYADGFDAEILKKKIAAHQALMVKQPTMKEYIDLLDLVFNRAARVRVPLAFNAEEAARERALATTIPAKFSGASSRRRDGKFGSKLKKV
jgi:hypothetical protein